MLAAGTGPRQDAQGRKWRASPRDHLHTREHGVAEQHRYVTAGENNQTSEMAE